MSDVLISVDLLCVIFSCHSCSRPLEFLVNFFASLMALLSVIAFGLVPLYTMGVIAISRYFRVAKGFFP